MEGNSYDSEEQLIDEVNGLEDENRELKENLALTRSVLESCRLRLICPDHSLYPPLYVSNLYRRKVEETDKALERLLLVLNVLGS